MTDIEINSLKTQLALFGEIDTLKYQLNWHIKDTARTIRDNINSVAKWPMDVAEKDLIVSIPKKDFDELMNFVNSLRNENYSFLPDHAKSYKLEIEIRENILKKT